MNWVPLTVRLLLTNRPPPSQPVAWHWLSWNRPSTSTAASSVYAPPPLPLPDPPPASPALLPVNWLPLRLSVSANSPPPLQLSRLHWLPWKTPPARVAELKTNAPPPSLVLVLPRNRVPLRLSVSADSPPPV